MFPRPTAARVLAVAGLAAVLLTEPGTVRAKQIIRETYYVAPVQRVIVSEPVVATRYVESTVVAPTSVVYETPTTVLTPSSYVLARTRYGLFGRPRETEYVVPSSYIAVTPTTYSYTLSPTVYRYSLTPTYYTETYRTSRPVYVYPRSYIVPSREVIVESPVYDEYVVPSDEVIVEPSRPASSPAPKARVPREEAPANDAEPQLRESGARRTQGATGQAPSQNKVIESTPGGAAGGSAPPASGAAAPPASAPDTSGLPTPPAESGTPPPAGGMPEPSTPVEPATPAPAVPGPGENLTFPDDVPVVPPAPEPERRETFRPAFPGTSAATSAALLVNALEGRVLSKETRQPEAGLQVVLSDQQKRYEERTATTDRNGRFVVPDIPDGDWAITIRSLTTAGTSRRYGIIRVTSGRPFDSVGRPYDRLVLNY